MEAGNHTFMALYHKASMWSPSNAAFTFGRGEVAADISLKLKQEGSFFPLVLYPRKWKAGPLWSNLLKQHINYTDGIGCRSFHSGQTLIETCKYTKLHWFVSFETLSTVSGKENCEWEGKLWTILDVGCAQLIRGFHKRVKQSELLWVTHYSCVL